MEKGISSLFKNFIPKDRLNSKVSVSAGTYIRSKLITIVASARIRKGLIIKDLQNVRKQAGKQTGKNYSFF